MSERHPLDAPILATIALIDAAAHARMLYGDRADFVAGRPIADHDYRFELTTESGARCTFGEGATAAEVGDWLRHEGHMP